MKALVLVYGLLALSNLAFAEGSSGRGGGRGVVCRDSQGNVQSVELLDLWEARIIYNRQAKVSNDSVSTQVENALQGLKYSMDLRPLSTSSGDYSPPDSFLLEEHQITNLFLANSPNVHRLHGVTLEPTNDSFEDVVPAGNGCEVEQIVNYIDSYTDPLILVNQDLVDKMDTTNQAALIVHEAYYAFLRDTNLQPESNSIRIRRAVGYVFAGNSFADIHSLLGSEYVVCENLEFSQGSFANAKSSLFYIYKGADGNTYALRGMMYGQMAIGFFSQQQNTATLGFDYYLTDKVCVTESHELLELVPGIGPVDFTQNNNLVFSCDGNKKLSIYLTSGSNTDIADPQLSEKLTCHLEHSSESLATYNLRNFLQVE